MFSYTLFLPFLLVLLLTPLVGKFAEKIGALDVPDSRKVHFHPKPLLGGLAIYAGFLAAVLLFQPVHPAHWPILAGSGIVLAVGIWDDLFNLTPSAKLLGQILAACPAVFFADLQVQYVNLPNGGILEFGLFSIPVTFLWIIIITNAMNLIDGLDGLSAGVSGIALAAIAGMASMMGDKYVFFMAVALTGSLLGFIPYNFYPAKIFMGDTGALFLGYIISVLSLLGFKNITFFSFLVPFLILGVPISDTVLVIIRRLLHKQPITRADRSHFHHWLLDAGFSHRQTVLILYFISTLLALSAFIFTKAALWGTAGILVLGLLLAEFLFEAGWAGKKYKPIFRLFGVKPERKREP